MDKNKNEPDCLNCFVHGRCSCGLGSPYCRHLYYVNREDRLREPLDTQLESMVLNKIIDRMCGLIRTHGFDYQKTPIGSPITFMESLMPELYTPIKGREDKLMPWEKEYHELKDSATKH